MGGKPPPAHIHKAGTTKEEIIVDKQKVKCPNCGGNHMSGNHMICVGLQWLPLVVVRKRDWELYEADESRQRGAVRLFVCSDCQDAFIEPSLLH